MNIKYLRELVSQTLETAQSEISNNKLRSADILLQIVNVEQLVGLKQSTGPVVDQKQLDLYRKLTQILMDKAKAASS